MLKSLSEPSQSAQSMTEHIGAGDTSPGARPARAHVEEVAREGELVAGRAGRREVDRGSRRVEEVVRGPEAGRVDGVGGREEEVPVCRSCAIDAGFAVKAVHRHQPAAVQAVVDDVRVEPHGRPEIGEPERSRRSRQTTADPSLWTPCRSVIWNELLRICMTCSGPTASLGSGGSPLVSGPLLLAKPSKPGCPIAGSGRQRGLHGRTEDCRVRRQVVRLERRSGGALGQRTRQMWQWASSCDDQLPSAMLPCAAGRFWRRSLDDFWWTFEAATAPSRGRMRPVPRPR